MALEIEFDESGMFVWLQNNRGNLTPERLKFFARLAARTALTDYAAGRIKPSLQDKFEPNAFATYDLSPRSDNYEKFQRRVFGRVLPYFSPKTRKGASNEHMRDILKRPGDGYRVNVQNETAAVVAVLKLPGARILNIIKQPWGEIYRREFLSFIGTGAKDAAAITGHAMRLFYQYLKDEVSKPRRRKRSALTYVAGETAT